MKTHAERITYIMDWQAKNPEKVAAYKKRSKENKRIGIKIPRMSVRIRKEAIECGILYEYKTLLWWVRTLGVFPQEAHKMLVQQGWRCQICKDLFGSETPNLDHNHVTNAVRGFLCLKCNAGIGMLRDDPFLVDVAATYLRFYQNGPQ